MDTGSTINLINEDAFKQLGNIPLQKTHIKAYPFNSTDPVKMKGKFQTLVESRKRITVATIYVTAEDGGCLLSNDTAQELGSISLHLSKIETPKTSQNKSTTGLSVTDKTVRNVINKHSKVFQGVGKLKNRQIELIVDKSVKPIAQRQRRIPFHLRAKDISEQISDTDETAWISPVVKVPVKDDQIRLCVDMRAANTAIKRVCHPIPTVRDISLDLNGAKYVTKLDMSQAYHQLELSTPSRSITTFTTHAGLYRLNISIMAQTQQLNMARNHGHSLFYSRTNLPKTLKYGSNSK